MTTATDFLCRVPAEVVAEYEDWAECVAFRFVKLDEDAVEIQVTRDLELLPRPGGDSGA